MMWCGRSIRSLLNPELTASWEKGLTYVAQGDITEDEYMGKLDPFHRQQDRRCAGAEQPVSAAGLLRCGGAFL